jgi:mono/diheme cytochrome c family protein
MFNINCSVCHGYAGEGDGLVNQRAMALAVNGTATWTTAKSLYDPTVIEQPVGRIFDTITNGRATMGPYGSRISPQDRWAIVLYVKALQETHRNAPPPPTTGEAQPAGGAEP